VSQARFQKQQREKARREKAAAKWERRQARSSQRDDAAPAAPAFDEAEVLTELAALHARFDAGEIPFEDFLTAKEELTQRLIQ
jgi:hypothetical protein